MAIQEWSFHRLWLLKQTVLFEVGFGSMQGQDNLLRKLVNLIPRIQVTSASDLTVEKNVRGINVKKATRLYLVAFMGKGIAVQKSVSYHGHFVLNPSLLLQSS